MSGRPIAFDRGASTLAVVLALALVEATGSRALSYEWGVGPAIPVVGGNALAAALSVAVLGAVWAVLRFEGVSAGDIGLSRDLVVPATATVAAYFLALNAAGAALAVASGNPGSVGYHWTVPPAAAVATFLWMLVVAGLVEEFVFRGYLQTKCVAILGEDGRFRIAVGIAVAGLLFAASHVPRILTDGAPGGMGPPEYLALLAVNGVAYGLLYEWTHNLAVPILVHAAGNMPGTAGILFFSTAGWPTWASVGYLLVHLGVVLGVILGYRRWAVARGRMPVWSRRTVTTDR